MRVQIQLPLAAVRRMRGLMEDLGIDNYRNFFQFVMTVFEWAIEERRRGREIVSLGMPGTPICIAAFPTLPVIRRQIEAGVQSDAHDSATPTRLGG